MPDWYKKKKAARFAKDGILKLINYLQEKKIEESSEPSDENEHNEMSFYRKNAAQDLRLSDQITQEEQVLKIRLQSRPKQQKLSPLNYERSGAHGNHRSCVRIERNDPTENNDEIIITEKHAETCDKSCDQEENVIVVRTLPEIQNRYSVRGTVRNSFIHPSSPIYNPANKDPVNLARFGQKNPLEMEKKEEKPALTLKAAQVEVGVKKKFDPQNTRSKTFNATQDFREELRKLQQMKQKISKKRNLVTKSIEGEFVDI